MENPETNSTPTEEPVKHSSLYDISRKIALAAVGAAVVAVEEIDKFVTQLAKEGELAEKDAKSIAKEAKEYRDKLVAERITERQADREKQRTATTRSDIEALTNKISELNKRLEELKQQELKEDTETLKQQ